MSFFSVFKTLSLLAVFSNVIMMCFLSFLSMDFVFCLKFVELFFPNLFLNKFIYLFLVVLGLHCCVGSSLVAGSRGQLFVAVHRLLTAVASLLQSTGSRSRGLNSCSPWALEHRLNSWGTQA